MITTDWATQADTAANACVDATLRASDSAADIRLSYYWHRRAAEEAVKCKAARQMIGRPVVRPNLRVVS